jgi:DNA-binding transcriptional ArsR family regulator
MALKYAYWCSRPEDCAISHNNLANYLGRAGEPPEVWLPHRLADGLISLQVGSGGLETSLRNLALSDLPDSPPPFDEVVEAVDRLEGVRFGDLFVALPQTYSDGDAALAALWEAVSKKRVSLEERKAARQAVLGSMPPEVRAAFDLEGDEFSEALRAFIEALPEDEREEILRRLRDAGLIGGGPDVGEVVRRFEPLLAAIAAVALGQGRDGIQEKVDAELEQLQDRGWLVRDAAHRIWAGERDPDALTDGLDEQDTALVLRVLELIRELQTG